jgi:hypothetical protein
MWGGHITYGACFFGKIPRAQLDGRMHGVCPLPYNLHTHCLEQLMISFLCIIGLMSSLFIDLHVASASRHLSLQSGEGSCICILCASGTTFCLLLTTHLLIPPSSLLIYPADLQILYQPKSIRSTSGFPNDNNPSSTSLGDDYRRATYNGRLVALRSTRRSKRNRTQ